MYAKQGEEWALTDTLPDVSSPLTPLDVFPMGGSHIWPGSWMRS